MSVGEREGLFLINVRIEPELAVGVSDGTQTILFGIWAGSNGSKGSDDLFIQPGHADFFTQQYGGGQPKRLQMNRGIYCPSMIPAEPFGNDSLFAEKCFANDASALLALSSEDNNEINSCLPQMQNPQLESQQASAPQINETSFDHFPDSVINQYRHEQFQNSKARQPPIPEFHESDPWTALEMNGTDYSRPAAKGLQNQWSQQGHRPAPFHNSHVDFQFGKHGHVTSRPRSDSGYGTFPNPNKSPPTESATQTQFSEEQLLMVQDCMSLVNNVDDSAFQSSLNLDFDQFTDHDQQLPFPYLQDTLR